jgi:peptidoglycan/xylan/chitin deacetylase (PgdA/CDA1 family)
VTFDVDAESPWLGADRAAAERVTLLSAGRFGVQRGLPRLLGILDEFDVPATFYVPGDTADRFPEELGGLAESRHDIGHHGYLHLPSTAIPVDMQRDEIERGIEALESRFGRRPRGYRSPSWDLTRATLRLLHEYGFEWDSSCMADDRPYYEILDGRPMLELPVHWSLDDWPLLASGSSGGVMASPQHVLGIWIDEFENAYEEGRLLTLTMHPEVIGRGYGAGVLRSFLAHVRDYGDVWMATHAEVADHVRGSA